MGIEISNTEHDHAIAQDAASLSFGLMNLDEFGYFRANVERMGVDAAKLGAGVVIATLREMGLVKGEIDQEKFIKAGTAVIGKIRENIMAERLRG